MIYISTSCVKSNKIKDSVSQLAKYGFKNIELSGGTEYYDKFEYDLLELQDKYSLNYRCHNYFPPPESHFVLNLASLDKATFRKSLEHLRKATQLAKKLSSNKFAFHAGFLIDISINEIGKPISKTSLFDRAQSKEQFCSAFKLLQEESEGIQLYIENNVLSKKNLDTYNGVNPLMMVSFDEYQELRREINFQLLFDVAHLKVSANSLHLNWASEFEKMLNASDYIHVSDNDGLSDLNDKIDRASELYRCLMNSNVNGKDFTIEVYSGLDSVLESYETLRAAIL